MSELELQNNSEMAKLLHSKLESTPYCALGESIPAIAVMAVGELSVICQLGLFAKIDIDLAVRLSDINILANKEYYTAILEL